MKCQIKSAFFPFTLHLAYNSIKIIERNPTLSDSFPCEQAFGCWRFFFQTARRKKPPAEPGSGRVGCLLRLAGGWMGGKRREKKKIEGCKDVTLLGKDTN